MLYCGKCRIMIRGDKVCCPLCRGKLTGEPEDGCFPKIKPAKRSIVSFFKIAVFTGVILEVLFLIIAFFIGWNLVLNVMILSVPLILLDIAIALFYRTNLLRLITVQAYIGMAVVLAFDVLTPGINWGSAFVIPGTFVFLAIATILAGEITRLRLDDYVIYLIFDCACSLLQIIPIVLGINTFPALAVISMGAMVILGAFVFIFRFRDLKDASSKYLDL